MYDTGVLAEPWTWWAIISFIPLCMMVILNGLYKETGEQFPIVANCVLIALTTVFGVLAMYVLLSPHH